jgi:hypothetical protein
MLPEPKSHPREEVEMVNRGRSGEAKRRSRVSQEPTPRQRRRGRRWVKKHRGLKKLLGWGNKIKEILH